jgi:hypothetical protein
MVHIHTKKFERCVKEVGAKSPGYNPYAVCTASVKKPFLKRK